MLAEIFRHWRYFIPRFLGYGTALGALFGGLTYPIFGIFFGGPWGFLGGLVLGILMGIGVPIYNHYFASDDADTYQSQLTFGAGLIATVVMALPLLFIYSLVAGLVTAYISHQYAEDPTMKGEKRKHSVDAYQRRDKVFTQAANSMMSKAKYFVGLMTIGGMTLYSLVSFFDPFASFDLAFLIGIGIAGLIYGFIVAAFIAAVNALFIVMANRLFFDPEMPKTQYKARIVPIVGILTLFLSMIVTFGVGAPFAAIAGAFGASKYADWYYEEDEEEKAKRSVDNLLDEEIDRDEDYHFIEEEQEKMLLRH